MKATTHIRYRALPGQKLAFHRRKNRSTCDKIITAGARRLPGRQSQPGTPPSQPAPPHGLPPHDDASRHCLGSPIGPHGGSDLDQALPPWGPLSQNGIPIGFVGGGTTNRRRWERRPVAAVDGVWEAAAEGELAGDGELEGDERLLRPRRRQFLLARVSIRSVAEKPSRKEQSRQAYE